jgi:hypothetical protein
MNLQRFEASIVVVNYGEGLKINSGPTIRPLSAVAGDRDSYHLFPVVWPWRSCRDIVPTNDLDIITLHILTRGLHSTCNPGERAAEIGSS